MKIQTVNVGPQNHLPRQMPYCTLEGMWLFTFAWPFLKVTYCTAITVLSDIPVIANSISEVRHYFYGPHASSELSCVPSSSTVH